MLAFLALTTFNAGSALFASAIFAVLGGFNAHNTWTRQKVKVRGANFSRAKRPVGFWIFLTLEIAFALACAGFFVWMVSQWVSKGHLPPMGRPQKQF